MLMKQRRDGLVSSLASRLSHTIRGTVVGAVSVALRVVVVLAELEGRCAQLLPRYIVMRLLIDLPEWRALLTCEDSFVAQCP